MFLFKYQSQNTWLLIYFGIQDAKQQMAFTKIAMFTSPSNAKLDSMYHQGFQ